MPGFTYAYSTANATPLLGPYLLGANLTGSTTTTVSGALRAGDLVVLTVSTDYGSSTIPVVRGANAEDLADLWNCGVLGVQQWDVITSSTGAATSQPTPAGVAAGAGVTYNLPNMSAGLPYDTATNFARTDVVLASEQNVFLGAMLAASSVASHALDNTLAGIDITLASGVPTFTINATATTKILRILRPNESDPLYGSHSGSVYFQFLPAYDQSTLGTNYDD